ncbi:MAG: DUF3043 domain-containing protein [Mycobacterium pseudokansasii]|uniref:DUF3043 domain-containing protein n=1 Tax=Mycobacterium pseudokansasii TaxID=2341080 RepID=A0A498QUX9_9MYCO|nr:DUF3043 domain-containing protein [Mycobacterium pseudokansasii]KZS68694.1 hypothetical protein A4G27_02755 [Mycobacterium kansasii]MBY0386798.1 DUF3043 domain-containing protein [Mycobacterium pseudokansasii]VAZ97033.1 hypothetical protein LAUMK35_03512 [Mycobacterium pseudokansasii]VAZ98416.1 hypothetical protein LAUMK21_03509 [Mycobacterium pseudokansasii]VBA52129.1 hypothetical protein LAUMK142_03400 [Mycobacterium pseudokansasii]
MKLLGRKKGHEEGAEVSAKAEDSQGAQTRSPAEPATSRGSRATGPKGRPTPKRSEARRSAKKGPVVPAPMTAAEARARRKSLAGPKLSRAERRAERTASRARMSERRERMMAGEEAYLLPRDQGPIRRYVRDVVDARRFSLLGLFMPSALALLFVMFAVPQLQLYMSPAMLVLMALMTIDGILLGRKVSRLVDAKFPSNTESRWKLGLYAAGRASQMRRMRAPRPQVERGASIG